MSKLQAQCSLDESSMRSFSTQISSAARQKQSLMQSASLKEATLEPTNRVRVDVLLVIDTDAQDWIRSSQNSDFEAFTLAAQTRLNNVTANSKLNIGFKIVRHMKVESKAGRFIQKLNELVGSGRSRTALSQKVSDERDRVGADLVAYLARANTGGGEMGIAMMANNVKGYERFGYSINAANGALGTTLIHELGHNFGAGHSRKQKEMEYGGPNEAFSPDAGGMYLEIPHNRFSGYNTIMAYNFYSSGGRTRFYQGIDQFSSPKLTFEGKLIGSLDDKVAPHKTADSRKVLLMTSPNIAKYRACKVECGPIGNDKYRVTVKKPTNGTLSCSPLSGPANTNVSCTATPQDGYELDNWTDKCIRENGLTCDFILNKNETVGITFKKKTAKRFNVTDLKPVEGSLYCVPMSGEANTTITCEAKPNYGYELNAWTDKCRGETGLICQFTLTKDETVGVTFKKKTPTKPKYFDLDIPKSIENGSLYCSPRSFLTENTRVACYAYPKRGYEIDTWLGACKSSSADERKCTFNATFDNRSVNIRFKLKGAPSKKHLFSDGFE